MRHSLAASLAGVFAVLVFFTGTASAQPVLRAEVDYRLIPAQPVSVASGVEVIDFFWYGCPHCYRLQPALERWISGKPADVTVRRIPVILRDTWAPHARIYYTLEALGEAERLHQEVYHDYHVGKLHMSRPEVMSEWAVRKGIARERWDAAYDSAEVRLKVAEAAKLTRSYDVTGTPSLVVNGHFLTSGNMAETLDGLIRILDSLVRMARDQAVSR